jgi:hypothetical protein
MEERKQKEARVRQDAPNLSDLFISLFFLMLEVLGYSPRQLMPNHKDLADAKSQGFF